MSSLADIIHCIESGAYYQAPGTCGPVDLRDRPDVLVDALRDTIDGTEAVREALAVIYRRLYGKNPFPSEDLITPDNLLDLLQSTEHALESQADDRAYLLENLAPMLADEPPAADLDRLDVLQGLVDAVSVKCATTYTQDRAARKWLEGFREWIESRSAPGETSDELDSKCDMLASEAAQAEKERDRYARDLDRARVDLAAARAACLTLEERADRNAEIADRAEAARVSLAEQLATLRRSIAAPPAVIAAPPAAKKRAKRSATCTRTDLGIPAALKALGKMPGARPYVILTGREALVDGATCYYRVPLVLPLAAPVTLEDPAGIDLSTCTIGPDGCTLTGADGRTRFLEPFPAGLEHDDAPPVPDGAAVIGTLTAADLTAIAEIRYAESRDESKPDLKGIRFQAGHAVAIDGRRIAWRRMSDAVGLESIALPAAALDLLKGAASVSVTLIPGPDRDTAPHVALDLPGGARIIAKSLTEPRYAALGVFRDILETCDNDEVYIPRGRVHAGDLAAALKALAPIARTVSETIRLEFGPDMLTVTALSSKAGRQVIGVPARDVPVDNRYAISINRKFLLEAIQAEPGEWLEWRGVHPTKAQRIGSGSVLMTIRTGV